MDTRRSRCRVAELLRTGAGVDGDHKETRGVAGLLRSDAGEGFRSRRPVLCPAFFVEAYEVVAGAYVGYGKEKSWIDDGEMDGLD